MICPSSGKEIDNAPIQAEKITHASNKRPKTVPTQKTDTARLAGTLGFMYVVSGLLSV